MSSSFTSNYFLNYNFANNLRKNKNFAKNLRNNNKKNICKKKRKNDYNCLINSNKGYEKYDVNRYFPKNNKEPVITNNFSHESYKQNYLLNDYFVSILRQYDNIKKPAIKKTKKQIKPLINNVGTNTSLQPKTIKEPKINKYLKDSSITIKSGGLICPFKYFLGKDEEKYLIKKTAYVVLCHNEIDKTDLMNMIQEIENIIKDHQISYFPIKIYKDSNLIHDIEDVESYIQDLKKNLNVKEKPKLLKPIKISPNYNEYKQKEISVGKKLLVKSKVGKHK